MPVTVLDLTADKDEANAHLAPEERAELAPIWTDELGFVRDDRGTWEAHALPDALGIAFATHESADDATTFAFVTALEDGFVVARHVLGAHAALLDAVDAAEASANGAPGGRAGGRGRKTRRPLAFAGDCVSMGERLRPRREV